MTIDSSFNSVNESKKRTFEESNSSSSKSASSSEIVDGINPEDLMSTRESKKPSKKTKISHSIQSSIQYYDPISRAWLTFLKNSFEPEGLITFSFHGILDTDISTYDSPSKNALDDSEFLMNWKILDNNISSLLEEYSSRIPSLKLNISRPKKIGPTAFSSFEICYQSPLAKSKEQLVFTVDLPTGELGTKDWQTSFLSEFSEAMRMIDQFVNYKKKLPEILSGMEVLIFNETSIDKKPESGVYINLNQGDVVINAQGNRPELHLNIKEEKWASFLPSDSNQACTIDCIVKIIKKTIENWDRFKQETKAFGLEIFDTTYNKDVKKNFPNGWLCLALTNEHLTDCFLSTNDSLDFSVHAPDIGIRNPFYLPNMKKGAALIDIINNFDLVIKDLKEKFEMYLSYFQVISTLESITSEHSKFITSGAHRDEHGGCGTFFDGKFEVEYDIKEDIEPLIKKLKEGKVFIYTDYDGTVSFKAYYNSGIKTLKKVTFFQNFFTKLNDYVNEVELIQTNFNLLLTQTNAQIWNPNDCIKAQDFGPDSKKILFLPDHKNEKIMGKLCFITPQLNKLNTVTIPKESLANKESINKIIQHIKNEQSLHEKIQAFLKKEPIDLQDSISNGHSAIVVTQRINEFNILIRTPNIFDRSIKGLWKVKKFVFHSSKDYAPFTKEVEKVKALVKQYFLLNSIVHMQSYERGSAGENLVKIRAPSNRYYAIPPLSSQRMEVSLRPNSDGTGYIILLQDKKNGLIDFYHPFPTVDDESTATVFESTFRELEKNINAAKKFAKYFDIEVNRDMVGRVGQETSDSKILPIPKEMKRLIVPKGPKDVNAYEHNEWVQKEFKKMFDTFNFNDPMDPNFIMLESELITRYGIESKRAALDALIRALDIIINRKHINGIDGYKPDDRSQFFDEIQTYLMHILKDLRFDENTTAADSSAAASSSSAAAPSSSSDRIEKELLHRRWGVMRRILSLFKNKRRPYCTAGVRGYLYDDYKQAIGNKVACTFDEKGFKELGYRINDDFKHQCVQQMLDQEDSQTRHQTNHIFNYLIEGGVRFADKVAFNDGLGVVSLSPYRSVDQALKTFYRFYNTPAMIRFHKDKINEMIRSLPMYNKGGETGYTVQDAYPFLRKFLTHAVLNQKYLEIVLNDPQEDGSYKRKIQDFMDCKDEQERSKKLSGLIINGRIMALSDEVDPESETEYPIITDEGTLVFLRAIGLVSMPNDIKGKGKAKPMDIG